MKGKITMRSSISGLRRAVKSSWIALSGRVSGRPSRRPEVKSPRERFESRLERAEAEMDKRFEANACPKEKLKNFEILGRLGAGSFAEVYLVEHKKSHKKYAMKVMSKADLTRRRIPGAIREKKLQYALRFDFLTELIYAFQDVRYLYLVMEFGQYGSLRSCISDRLSEWTTKGIAMQIILALEYLHECNVAHRDLKPDNILIFNDGYIKLADFGVAKKFTNRTYSLIGTWAYMSPEVRNELGYSKNCDWWSMGVTLFECLYDLNPFFPYDEDAKVEFPAEVDPNSAVCRFIAALLEEEYACRLGCLHYGVLDIKTHDWFSDISFQNIYTKQFVFFLNYESEEPPPCDKYSFLEQKNDGAVQPSWAAEF